MSQQPQSDTGKVPDRRRLSGLLLMVAAWLLVAVLVIVAIGSAWARYMAEHIDDFRPTIESLLSDRLGQEVSIGSLSARWHGPDPVLQVSDLDISHKSQPDDRALALQHLLLRLDGPRSLLRLGLVFERIEADGLDVVVERQPEGGFTVEGLKLPESGEGITDVENLSSEQWLDPQRWMDEMARRIANPEIRLTRLTLGLKGPDSSAVYVDIPQLDMAYKDDLVTASGRAMRQGTLDQLVTFSVRGDHLFEGHFTGDVWADVTPGGFFEGITRGLEWRNVELLEFDASAKAWLSFQDGRLQRLNSRLEMSRLHVSKELATLPALEDMSARIGWRRQGDGGSLHIRDLQWRWQDETVAWPQLKVEHDPQQFRVESTGVPVGPLAHMAVVSNLLSARIEPEILGLRPEGSFSSLHLRIPRNDPMEFDMTARLDGVSVQPHRGAPGGSNLQGQVWVDRDSGRVRAQGQNMVLNAPELFAAPLTFTSAEGDVGWLVDGGLTRVYASDLQATYGESTEVEGAFDLRLDRYGDDNLGLKLAIADADASMLPDVLPAKLLDPELYDWLTSSITGGHLIRGDFYGHGQIGRGLPSGSFSTAMEYQFREASLIYDSSWPEVSDASGTVTVHNSRASINVDHATTGGLQLDHGFVELLQKDGVPTVEVTTRAGVTGERANFWLGGTPLRDLVGTAGRSISLGGDYQLDLSLTVPITEGRGPEVEARVTTNNGRVRYPDARLGWENISGGLTYSSQTGISEDALSARFLGEPVNVRFRADPERHALAITQTGHTDPATLAEAFMPQGQEIPGLSGRMPYSARLDFVPDGGASLAVTANTAGLSSEWPAPLGREPGPSESVEVLLRWPKDGQLLLETQWGERLSAALEWAGDEFRGGQVVIGDGSARFAVESGLTVRAAFDRLSPTRWQNWLERLGMSGDPPASSPGNAGTGERFSWLNSLDVRMKELVLGDHGFPGLRVMARPQPDGWLLSTNSETAAGSLWIPDSGDRVTVDLERLALVRDHYSPSGDDSVPALLTPTEQLEAFRGMSAGRWPEVEVRIESLMLEGDPAGAWSFVMSPSPEQVTLRDLQGRLQSLAFDGQLRWGVTTGEQITVVQGVMEGGGLQDLANLVGKDIPLANKSSTIDLNIAWPGRPDQFAVGDLSGEFSVRLDDGVILENNDTAQLFRLFNLLNTDTLQRRLQFDFSDLYEAGVAFDALYGKARLEHGILTWDPDLQLAGPSGALRLSGVTNLADESLDMRLVVILPLTQNLPLAAILMGASPPVGGALFVLDKLLGEPLSKLTSATYSVGGTWDNPEVNLRNIFDSGNQE